MLIYYLVFISLYVLTFDLITRLFSCLFTYDLAGTGIKSL